MKTMTIIKIIAIAFVVGCVAGAIGWAFLRPGPAVVADSGTSTMTEAERQQIITHIRDSISTSGQVISAGTKTKVSGPGKRDTIWEAYHDTVSYEEYLQATLDQNQAIERQTAMYQTWLDSLKANNSRVLGGRAPDSRPWLGLGLGAEIESPLADPLNIDEAWLWPMLRFGKRELAIVPKIGYNFKDEKQWRVGIVYRGYFR